ncbi:ubiquinone/menaquinone biosynthesis C-methylase UbiE [Runella defluvii]|uniref:Ubiquinone/menaquinone biosynthesis C-methylase UbiE n=1 Tax=Runella defluvii TaxID=370973 RepID=A0A7W5ZUS7_9BACT|nr:class I SAM-dependent methyltransferase [Runella defluvii]MBB3841932.1 ubiquinone/menaquinone biosynthesis C-methylase UbiE [Runella defluvii]
MSDTTYIPALRFNWLTKIYDPLIQWTTPERLFKQDLIIEAGIETEFHVLDFGCGTATLSMMTKSKYPSAFVTGVDVDAEVLAIAKNKLKDFPYPIRLDQYDGMKLPYPDETFDRVISSLVFHHLTPIQKAKAFQEIKRVLKFDGELYIADWGKAENSLMRGLFYGVQLLDGFKTTRDNVSGLMPSYLLEAGFLSAKVLKKYRTVFGTLELFRAKK